MDKPKKRPKAVNVSWVIAGLLIASGAVRFAEGTGAAIAREVANITSNPDQAHELYSGCVAAADMDELLEDIDAKNISLEERRIELDLREKDVNAGAQLVAAEMQKLAEAEASLAELISLAETAAEGDISNLIDVYQQMKPKEAAAVFEEMAPEFAAGFLGRMRPDSAARVFAGLSPKTAYSISAILAGRNVNAPTE